MIVDLIEVKPKLNKFKVFMCILILLLLISIPIMFIIKNHQNNKLYNDVDIGLTDTTQKESNTSKNGDLQSNEGKDIQPNQEKIEEIPKVTLTKNGFRNIKNIYTSEEKIAYLTFDDGPSKTVTPLILDVLRQENVKATFFVLGSRVELYPELVKQEYEERHYIANHGYSHIYKDIYSNPQAVLEEYDKTQIVIRQAIGVEDYLCNLFRFPGGSNGGKYNNIKSQAKKVLEENNIAYVDWNALNNDATGESLTKEQMFDKLVETTNGKNSVVILMHDAGDKILTYEILQQVIQYLRDEGYTFKNFYDIIE